MTWLRPSRLLLLLVCAVAIGCGDDATSPQDARGQGQGAVDQYLERTPDGKGGAGGSGGSGGSGSSGAPSPGGSSPTEDTNGDGKVDSKDAPAGGADEPKSGSGDEGSGKNAAVPGASGGPPSASPNRASESVPREGEEGGSGALWIVLALLVAGPVAVLFWWRFGPQGKSSGDGDTGEPQPS